MDKPKYVVWHEAGHAAMADYFGCTGIFINPSDKAGSVAFCIYTIEDDEAFAEREALIALGGIAAICLKWRISEFTAFAWGGDSDWKTARSFFRDERDTTLALRRVKTILRAEWHRVVSWAEYAAPILTGKPLS